MASQATNYDLQKRGASINELLSVGVPMSQIYSNLAAPAIAGAAGGALGAGAGSMGLGGLATGASGAALGGISPIALSEMGAAGAAGGAAAGGGGLMALMAAHPIMTILGGLALGAGATSLFGGKGQSGGPPAAANIPNNPWDPSKGVSVPIGYNPLIAGMQEQDFSNKEWVPMSQAMPSDAQTEKKYADGGVVPAAVPQNVPMPQSSFGNRGGLTGLQSKGGSGQAQRELSSNGNIRMNSMPGFDMNRAINGVQGALGQQEQQPGPVIQPGPDVGPINYGIGQENKRGNPSFGKYGGMGIRSGMFGNNQDSRQFGFQRMGLGRRFAEGGMVPAPLQKDMGENRGDIDTIMPPQTGGPSNKELIAMAVGAIKGKEPEAQMILAMFVKRFGQEALQDLVGRIRNSDAPDTAGRVISGPGGPKDDMIPAVIDGQEPARLSAGEYVVPTDAVNKNGGPSGVEKKLGLS